MKPFHWLIVAILVISAGLYLARLRHESAAPEPAAFAVMPITHATAVLTQGDAVIYLDPTGGAEAFAGKPAADIVLVTDVHGDHLSTTTLAAVTGDAMLIVPQAVRDLLPAYLASRATVLANGETIEEKGFRVTGVPMYNLPETAESRHARGRGNGYLIERDGQRAYVAGDTAGTPEMKALEGIDLALVPMNLPFTMSVDEAAEAVLAFKPRVVYPFHYRGQDGLADVGRFKELVNAGDSAIQVVLADWYPQQ